MKKLILSVLVMFPVMVQAQLSQNPVYCDNRVRPCILMNDYGDYFGQIMNISSGSWGLGYGLSQKVNGTSVLRWSNAGVVTIPGTLTVTGAITGTASAVAASGVTAGALASTVIASSIAVNAVRDASLYGSITPSKITGTAAILGANSFTAGQTVIGSVSVSSSATSAYTLRNCGAIITLSTMTITDGCIVRQTSDNSVWLSTRTVVPTDGDATCAGTVCYVKLSN